jgi:glycyl-tRNA synthetase beta chain
MPDLLIELLSEEIPARMQAKASDDLRRLVTDGLVESGLTYRGAAAFATPRRLALSVEGLSERSRPLREERRGPRTDAPTQAVEGFLRSTGLSLEQLERRAEKKGEVFVGVVERPGREAAEIVAAVLERTVREFPWPKSMRWGEGSLRWVRPLQSILCILADETGVQVVPLEVDGLRAGDRTRGHRVHAPGEITVSSAEDYEAKLRRARVVLRPEERMERIRHDAMTLAFARGLEVVEDEGLLREVAGLVEWPVTLMGGIEEQFLGLPPEVLRTSMKEHQKFLSVRNPRTGRIEGFVAMANLETADDGATILAGNAKVLRARLSDARFFWERDLAVARAGLEEWKEGLKAVTFHNKLGSQWDRVERIMALAREIAPFVGADPERAAEAAEVAKLDLRSAMVGEFPELQGLMGRYYAEAAGRPEEVARAAQEHYSPLGPSDEVPTSPVSVAVALADKIDTLTGFWAIDEKPTGSKDPFALRRAALGAIRLVLAAATRVKAADLIEDGFEKHRQPKLDALEKETLAQILEDFERGQEVSEAIRSFLNGEAAREVEVINSAVSLQPAIMERHIQEAAKAIASAWRNQRSGIDWRGYFVPARDDLLAFLHDRLKVHLRDGGIPHDVINACLAMPGNDDLTLLVRRAEALAALLKTDDGTNLVQLYKRAANILSQAEAKDGVEYSFGADPKWAEAGEERALFAALDAAEGPIREAMAREDFAAAMQALAGLRRPIDAFFEAVQVNSDNGVIRRNRLNLLSRIRALCLQVADLSRVEG